MLVGNEVWVVGLLLVGCWAVADLVQRRDPVRRIYPVLGSVCRLLGRLGLPADWFLDPGRLGRRPFDPRAVSLIRARAANGGHPMVSFGPAFEVGALGQLTVANVTAPVPVPALGRVLIPGQRAGTAFSASLLNVGALGFGPMSARAILAINKACADGGFAQNTGEDGLTPLHDTHPAQLIWQLGTGYWGCVDDRGRFDRHRFTALANRAQVAAVEIKLSQGGKPGQGGFLPGAKNRARTARLLSVSPGIDIVSPPGHSAFRGHAGLLRFTRELAQLSGKPVGIKLCPGSSVDFLRLCRTMLELDLVPDFLTIDGAEGGSGAAPTEAMDHVGVTMLAGLRLVHQALVGCGLRERTKLIAAGRIASGFDIFRAMAYGADICYSARAVMIAMGCLQVARCHQGSCPVGLATQSSWRERGLHVAHQADRIRRFHESTLQAFSQLLAVAGLTSPSSLGPQHLLVHTGPGEARPLDSVLTALRPGELLGGAAPDPWGELWDSAVA